MRLQRRMMSVGPLENEAYRQLTKVAKANDHENAEIFVTNLIDEICEDANCSIWVPIAITKEDLEFAQRLWSEDFRVMLDAVLADALDMLRAK